MQPLADLPHAYTFYGREHAGNPFSGGEAGSFSEVFGPGVWQKDAAAWTNVPYPACIDVNDDGKLDVLVSFGKTGTFSCVSL